MPTRSIDAHMQNVLDAAEALLAARDKDKLTPSAWGRLRRAVNAWRGFHADLDRWSIVDDVLTCRAGQRIARSGFRSYLAVAAVIDKRGGRSFRASDLRRSQKLPAAEVRVALKFLLLHGCIVDRGGRKCAAVGSQTYIDAVKAWNALQRMADEP